MSVSTRAKVQNIASALRLTVHHFARGTFPVRDRSALPVTRIFSVLENPDGWRNSVSDENSFHALQAGCLYVIPVHHCVCMQLNENLQFLSLQIRLEILPGIDIFSTCKRIFCFTDSGFVRRAEGIYDILDDSLSAVALNAFAFEIVANCLNSFYPEELDFTSRFDAWKDLIDYLLRDCHAGITVGKMACLMHLGREAFTRKFTADTGSPPKRFFNRFLLRRACDLLLQPSGSVRETSRLLNFSNEYYFSRFFKKLTGISPMDYRKYHLPVLRQSCGGQKGRAT